MSEAAKPVAGYIRVSRIGDRTGESYQTVEVQKKTIEQWAKAKDLRVVFFEPEENVSGGSMNRPILNEVMAKIASGELGGIVVYTYDRFARTMIGGLTEVEKLLNVGAVFASATEPRYDLTTADGMQMFQMNLMMAEYFRRRITQVWKSSVTYAVNRGVHISPSVAYGYNKDDSKRLIPNEAAPYVGRAYVMRAEEGKSYVYIADWLNENAPKRMVKHKGEWTHSPFTNDNVQAMLGRKVYLGIAHWGEQVNENAHEPLVRLDTWIKAQERVQLFSKECQTDEIALLHGLIRCAGCRFGMSRAKHLSHGTSRYYYRCGRVRASGTCTCPAQVRADEADGIDAYVESVVCAELDRRHSTYEGVEDTQALAKALHELEETKADLAAFQGNTKALRLMGEDEWTAALENYVSAVKDAESIVQEMRATEDSPELSGLTSEAYRSLAREERAKVLRAMIDAIFVRRSPRKMGRCSPSLAEQGTGRVLVMWRGCGPADLPVPSRKAEIVPFAWPVEYEAPAAMATA